MTSATVNVSITGAATQSGTAPCTAGTWTYTTSPTLATQGSYSVSATQADTAGNTGTSGAKTFKIVPPIVHVSTPGNGGSATGDGSASAPVDTVSGAITLAQSYGFNQIRISQGTFSEGTTGVSLVTNLAISGGWNVGFTAQSGINTSTVIQGGQQAVLADGVTGVTLSQLMLSGMGASAVDRSVYGLACDQRRERRARQRARHRGHRLRGNRRIGGRHGCDRRERCQRNELRRARPARAARERAPAAPAATRASNGVGRSGRIRRRDGGCRRDRPSVVRSSSARARVRAGGTGGNGGNSAVTGAVARRVQAARPV